MDTTHTYLDAELVSAGMCVDGSAEPLIVHLFVLAEVGHGEDGKADGRHELLLQ